MNRKDSYNETKLTSISNGRSVIDTYVDSFDIEKVKVTIAELEGAKRRINAYIEFSDFLRIAEQVKSQAIFKKIKAENKPVDLYRGGNGFGNEVSSVSLTMNMSGEKIYFNAMSCPGVRTGNNSILPQQGVQDSDRVKISVPASYEDCLAMFIYAEKAIDVYLKDFFPKLFEKARERRNAQSSNESGYYADPDVPVYYPDNNYQ